MAKKKIGKVAKRIGRGLLGRAKPRAMAAGIGGAVRLIEGVAADKVEFMKDNWYGTPLAMFLGSLAIGNERISTSLATIAGYRAAFNYELNQFQTGKRETSPVPQFKQEAPKNTGLLNQPSGNTAGADETDDAGLMFSAN